MGVLVLRPQDHAGLLDLRTGVELMRQGFIDCATSPVNLSNPRTRTNTPDGFRMTVHQGVSPTLRGACTAARGERVRIEAGGRQKYAVRGRPVFTVFDTETAELRMIMIGEPTVPGFEDVRAMAGFHTACVAAAGTDWLAHPGARRVGVLGSGGQARWHLAALAAVRSFDEVRVYSPTREHREAYARRMEAQLGIPVHAVERAEEVVQFAEILLVCTNSNRPVLDGRLLRPGCHVTSIVHSNKELLRAGLVQAMRQEIDDETLRRASLIVTTSKAQEELDQPEVLYGAAQRGVVRWEDVVELADVINGRASPADAHRRGGITFLKNAGGWGIGASALFRGFYERARERGVGLELDIDGLEPAY